MKTFFDVRLIPAASALLGAAAFLTRRALYAVAVDGTGRLTSGHPLSLLLAALSLGAVALAAVYSRKECTHKGIKPGLWMLSGYIAFALGIGATVFLSPAPMSGTLGFLWSGAGALSAPCLLAAGFVRYRGKTPGFLTYMIPAVFLTAHLINHYQLWCSNPQIQDVLFPLFATVALTVAAYQRGAICENCGSRRQLLGAADLSIYLCLAELAVTAYPWLFLGGALWAGTSLYAREVEA